MTDLNANSDRMVLIIQCSVKNADFPSSEFWYQSWFKLSESLAHLVNYTMLRACCDASVALRMSFV